MFLTLNQSNLIVDISDYANYVKPQSNGVKITCPKEEAAEIYSANTDKFYPLKNKESIGDVFTLVEVGEIPPDVVAGYHSYNGSEFYISEKKQAELERKQASDDVFAILVDQEYRLMLLELGVE